MNVTLVVTGKLEAHALGAALQQLFPTIRFTTIHDNSFTSSPLPEAPRTSASGSPTNAQRLVAHLVAAVAPGRRGKPADRAILVDDLEVENVSWPARAVSEVIAAVNQHIETFPSMAFRARARAAVRERCSFHLMVPMLEAHFFSNGAKPLAEISRKPSLATPDVEYFVSNDPDYLAAHPEPRAAVHPKLYLEWLMSPERYREVDHGARFLGRVDWVGATQIPNATLFLRALLLDLADSVGDPTISTALAGTAHPLVALGSGSTLRNA